MSKSEEQYSARGLEKMDLEIKKKLQKGSDYNLKIVIRGDVRTGKTQLFRRLQRKEFVHEYKTTPSIQVGTIPWDYKVSHDRIKVDVWDIVDRCDSGSVGDLSSHQVNRKEALKGSQVVLPLDAQNCDVYKNAHCVIFTINPMKKWTLSYVEKLLPEVPRDVDVLILVNYRDLDQTRRQLTETEIQMTIESWDFPSLHVLEASMKDLFGMKPIRCFLNIPFLRLKRKIMEAQLVALTQESQVALEEFSMVSQESKYELYLQWLESRKNSVQVKAPPPEPKKEDLPAAPEPKKEDPPKEKKGGMLSRWWGGEDKKKPKKKKKEVVTKENFWDVDGSESEEEGWGFDDDEDDLPAAYLSQKSAPIAVEGQQSRSRSTSKTPSSVQSQPSLPKPSHPIPKAEKASQEVKTELLDEFKVEEEGNGLWGSDGDEDGEVDGWGYDEEEDDNGLNPMMLQDEDIP